LHAELDHVFVCCSLGAPEASTLTGLGIREGSGNVHPGQGTAWRRFFFANAYLERLWVSNPQEAQRETVRATRLWDRWFNRGRAASRFGIVLRATGDPPGSALPFPTWAYHPSYLPPEITIDVARDTPLSEPEFFCLAFQGARARLEPQPVTHGVPASEITGILIHGPGPQPRSVAARAIEAAGLITFHEAEEHRLELIFDRATHGGTADLGPTLPLILRW
jgi:hypothetical protein